jgi:hypothetical protein
MLAVGLAIAIVWALALLRTQQAALRECALRGLL